MLFTLSFSYYHFIETLLLQKTQPLIAILLGSLWLRERVSRQAWIWIPLAIVGAYLIVIPDPLHPQVAWADFHLQASLLALAAAALWGSATVFGRYALEGVTFPTMTSLRFALGMPVLGLVLLIIGGGAAFGQYRGGDGLYYLGLAFLPGLIAMLLYYRGLANTPASIATVAELAFPITGVIVNMYLVSPRQSITGMQVVGDRGVVAGSRRSRLGKRPESTTHPTSPRTRAGGGLGRINVFESSAGTSRGIQIQESGN